MTLGSIIVLTKLQMSFRPTVCPGNYATTCFRKKRTPCKILKQRGTEVWGESFHHLVHHQHLIRNGKWGEELFLVPIYKLSWCDQNYVWEEGSPVPLLNTLPSSGDCELESWAFPSRNKCQRLKTEHPPYRILPLIISKINDPEAFVDHLPTSLTITRRKGWFLLLDSAWGGHGNTKTRWKSVWHANSFLWLTGWVGRGSFVNLATHAAKPLAQLEEVSISKLICAWRNSVTRPCWKAICWNHFACRKSCVY